MAKIQEQQQTSAKRKSFRKVTHMHMQDANQLLMDVLQTEQRLAKNIQKTQKLMDHIEKEEILHLRISKFLEDFYLKYYEIQDQQSFNHFEQQRLNSFKLFMVKFVLKAFEQQTDVEIGKFLHQITQDITPEQILKEHGQNEQYKQDLSQQNNNNNQNNSGIQTEFSQEKNLPQQTNDNNNNFLHNPQIKNMLINNDYFYIHNQKQNSPNEEKKRKPAQREVRPLAKKMYLYQKFSVDNNISKKKKNQVFQDYKLFVKFDRPFIEKQENFRKQSIQQGKDQIRDQQGQNEINNNANKMELNKNLQTQLKFYDNKRINIRSENNQHFIQNIQQQNKEINLDAFLNRMYKEPLQKMKSKQQKFLQNINNNSYNNKKAISKKYTNNQKLDVTF